MLRITAGLKAVLCLFLIGAPGFSGRAQTAPAPLPVHALRSISPAEADFQDLEFLKQEIGPARVVLLGEASHGEGNVFEAKIRLIRFLRERMGFTTLAFESGFFDLHKAQQELEAGHSAPEALGNSVFPVWMNTQEFQALLPLVGPGRLRVAGFDPQLSGDYGGDLVDDLRAFLAPEKGSAALSYDYLDEVISFMGEHYGFLPGGNLSYFEKELGQALRLTQKAGSGKEGKRRAEAAFWQQCLRSLLAQARDYALNDPGSKDETSFKATDSNPRDAQMADNLVWYVKQHPQEKVICWGALPHFANKVEVLGDAEMQTYRPMGRAVKAALGADQVYILGTLAGGGAHGFVGAEPQPVPAPAAGTLEAELLAQPADYAFVSLKHDAPGRLLTTYAFEYKPYAGAWSEIVDGFLFLRSVNPPHGLVVSAGALATTAAVDSVGTSRRAPGALNPAAQPRRVSAGPAGYLVRGTVLDQKTGAPVPYASVASSKAGLGTVADGQGRFALKLPGAGSLQISSVGYATVSVAAPAGGAPLSVKLVPAATELAGVQVRGESLDPRKIMKKVIAAAATNYEQQDYMAEIYSHQRTLNFDTLTSEAEYVSQLLEPAGYRDLTGGFLMRGPLPTLRIQEKHILKSPGHSLTGVAMGVGYFVGGTDPVRTSPLFKTSTLRKFELHLDSVVERGGETGYIISFAARHANHRSTGTYLEAGYSGRIYVQQRTYAVTHYEALWQFDTVYWNNAALKHYGRHDQISRAYNTVLADSRTDQVVEYVRSANGRYHVRSSISQGVSVGHVLGGRSFHYQTAREVYFKPLPAGTLLLPLDPRIDPRLTSSWAAQLPYVEYHPAFWEAYQRPGR